MLSSPLLASQFLRKDAELFNAIVGDLFPGLEIPEQDYGDLEECVIKCAEDRKLQPLPSFVLKASLDDRYLLTPSAPSSSLFPLTRKSDNLVADCRHVFPNN